MRSDLARRHSEVFRCIADLCLRAREGKEDTPGDIRAVVELLTEEAITSVFEAVSHSDHSDCAACRMGVMHVYPLPL